MSEHYQGGAIDLFEIDEMGTLLPWYWWVGFTAKPADLEVLFTIYWTENRFFG